MAKRKSQSKKKISFWQRMKVHYRLSLIKENSLEEAFSVRTSRLKAFWFLLAFIIVLIALTVVVIANTPIKNYLPGHLDAEIRQEMVTNALRADSLEQALHLQTAYLKNMTSILRGDMTPDAIPELDSLSSIQREEIDLERSDLASGFVDGYEEEEKYNLSMFSASTSLPENLIFYRPVKGMISDSFNKNTGHLGIDIATSPKESVLATMKGIVIFAGFEASAGYVIQIQHPNGIVSVYKHNAILLKKQGEEVAAGEAIALAGNSGSLSTGTHLHFELWYQGTPLNPEEFITF